MDFDLYAQRARLLPAETSTLAKSPLYAGGIRHRMFAATASGAYFTDTAGDRWLDLDMGLGSVVWGHSHPIITESITKQAHAGICMSVPSVIEGELAERVLSRLYDFEQIQFAKNGADVTTAAVRVARSVTGKKKVLLGRYHGWHDWSAAHHYGEPNHLGIPEEVVRVSQWLERESAESVAETLTVDRDVAAIVVCPEHWDAEALREVRRLATAYGVLLVFDEVKAGLRYGRRGVHGAFGIIPDLLCLGKGLANGMPLAALLGPRDLMRQLPQVRFSSTHATETLSMAAATAGETLLAAADCWPTWQQHAREAMDFLCKAIADHGLETELAVNGYPGTFWIGSREGHVVPAFQTVFVQALAENKIFSRGYVVVSAAHTREELDLTCVIADNVLKTYRNSASQHMRKNVLSPLR